jgi:hypothetical protein
MKKPIPIAIRASGMPIPIPIFAPLDNLLEPGAGVCVCDVVEDEVEVVVGLDIACDEVEVASANAFKSELCHQTGIPEPYIE